MGAELVQVANTTENKPRPRRVWRNPSSFHLKFAPFSSGVSQDHVLGTDFRRLSYCAVVPLVAGTCEGLSKFCLVGWVCVFVFLSAL